MKKLLYSIISIWFCLGSTVLSQNPKWINYNTTNSNIPSDSINCIAIDGLGNKWIGTRSEGLAKFDGTNWTVYNESNSDLPENYVYSLIIDESGNKWIGTCCGGLAKFDGLNWTIYDTSNSGLPSNWVSSLAIDGSGNKWIGTGYGLAKFDDTYWNVYNPGWPYITRFILSLAVDVSNNVWFKSYDGLTKFDGTNWTHYSSPISGGIFDRGCGIAIDELGNKWIGIDGELLQFDDTIWTIYTNPFPHSLTIWDIEIDESSIKWLSVGGLTENNLRKFNGSNWEAIDTSGSSLSSAGTLMCIAIDESDNKWIGTLRGGLFVFNEGGIVSVEENLSVHPTEYNLFQNYPNPFNPTTTIKYSVPQSSDVLIKVFDVLGSEVETLVNEEKPVGSYEINWNAENLPSGVYFYQLQAGDFVETKKMVLLR
jgi:ligand-binding sensor domain-containing protein